MAAVSISGRPKRVSQARMLGQKPSQGKLAPVPILRFIPQLALNSLLSPETWHRRTLEPLPEAGSPLEICHFWGIKRLLRMASESRAQRVPMIKTGYNADITDPAVGLVAFERAW